MPDVDGFAHVGETRPKSLVLPEGVIVGELLLDIDDRDVGGLQVEQPLFTVRAMTCRTLRHMVWTAGNFGRVLSPSTGHDPPCRYEYRSK